MKSFVAIMAVVAVFGFFAHANALLIVSGDGNIADYLTDAGNQQLFTNVLSGGSDVKVLENIGRGGSEDFDLEINNYYNGLSSANSEIITAVNSITLAGADLLVLPMPDDAFADEEMNAITTFYSNGGSIFFLGENSAFIRENESINAALTALGSGMQLTGRDWFDGDKNIATGSRIVSDPLTAGVAAFAYASPSIVSGGTTLVYGTENRAILAYENNVTNVPEPSMLFLLCMGIISLTGIRRKS